MQAVLRRPRSDRVARTAAAVRDADRMLLGFIALGLAVRIVYWAVTKHRFEDGLITVTHARNVRLGLGLTHHPGEGHVHGFTSAVSVLVPLAGELVKLGSGFVALRLATLVTFVVACVYAFRIAAILGLARWATAFVLAYLALDYNNVLYAMAGMETQIAVAVLLAGVYQLLVGDATKLGFALGIGLLTRPDFLLWLAPALLALGLSRGLRPALRSGGIALAVVAPWIIFTVAYYGSPVPNTIRAKQQSYTQHPDIGHTPASVVHFVQAQLEQHKEQWHYLVPFKENFSVAQTPIASPWLFFLAVAMLALAISGARRTRAVPRWWAAIAYVVIFVIYKILLLPPTYYEWYLPPVMALVVLLVGAGLTHLRLSAPRLAPGFAIVFTALLVWQMAAFIPIDRKVQQIEDHVRTQVGLRLRAAVRPGEAVSSESAGYIGYYSRAELWDYPGLTSPKARKTLKRLGKQGNALQWLVDALRPKWVVYRPFEYDAFQAQWPKAAADYEVVDQVAWKPAGSVGDLSTGNVQIKALGLTIADGDARFLILRRRT